MSRFQNLEFGEESRVPRGSGSTLKDESFYLAEAQAAYESGRFEAGLRAYAKALEFNPKQGVAWCGQVRMLIELQEFREAKVWADKALEILPNDPELLAAKAVALARCGDLKAALAFSDAAIEERGDSPYVWLARGDVLLARREPAAEFCFDRALAKAGFDWFHLWLAARVQAFYEHFARALRLAQQALEAATDRAVVWLEVGECQLALGLAGPARASFEQARQLDPARADAVARMERQPPGLGIRLRGVWRRWFS